MPTWNRRRAHKLSTAAARRSSKIGGGAHKLTAAAPRGRCHKIKSPPKQSLPLTDMKSPPVTLYRNKVSPIEIESPVYDTKSLPSENRPSSVGCICACNTYCTEITFMFIG